MIVFPKELGCWVSAGFSNTAPQAKRYLGKKHHEDRMPIINAKFVVRGDINLNKLFIWWVNTAKYGIEPFTTTLPFMGGAGYFKSVSVSDLIAVYVDGAYEIDFTLVLGTSLFELAENPQGVPIAPNAPTNFRASDNEIDQITFTWDNPTIGYPPPDFRLYTSSLNMVLDKVNSPVTVPKSNPQIKGVPNGYFLVADNSAGSSNSNHDDGHYVLAGAPVAPNNPTNFKASDNEIDQITFTWDDPTIGHPKPTFQLRTAGLSIVANNVLSPVSIPASNTFIKETPTEYLVISDNSEGSSSSNFDFGHYVVNTLPDDHNYFPNPNFNDCTVNPWYPQIVNGHPTSVLSIVDLTFKVRCTKPNFATPVDVKTLGIKGDGSDESHSMAVMLNKGGSFLFKDIEVLMNDGAIVTGNDKNIKMVFENSKLVADDYRSGYDVNTSPDQTKNMIEFQIRDGFVEIDGAELDGGKGSTITESHGRKIGFVCSAIKLWGSHEITNCHIHHFASNTGQSTQEYSLGIASIVDVGRTVCSSIYKNKIHDIYGGNDGVIANTQGGSYAVWHSYNSDDRVLNAYVEDNDFDFIYGEEGCGNYCIDQGSNANNTSSFFINNNRYSNMNRRFIKGFSDNITFTHNDLSMFSAGSPYAINGAYAISLSGNNMIVSGNTGDTSGFTGIGIISLDGTKNGHVFNNRFYARGNEVNAYWIRTRNNEDVVIEDNVVDIETNSYFKFEGLNVGSGITIRRNEYKIVDGTTYFSKMYGSGVDAIKKNITIEDNTFDGGYSGVVHAVKFKTILDLAYSGIALDNVKVIGNKVIGGVNKNTDGYLCFEDNGGVPANGYSYTNVLFKDNEADGASPLFRILDSTGITFTNNVDNN